jgi:ABC-type nitrate/sulfonate/bicarbonate transport system ATPase subunit
MNADRPADPPRDPRRVVTQDAAQTGEVMQEEFVTVGGADRHEVLFIAHLIDETVFLGDGSW